MDAGTITALATGIAGVIGAVTALVALFKHTNNPDPHKGSTVNPPSNTSGI